MLELLLYFFDNNQNRKKDFLVERKIIIFDLTTWGPNKKLAGKNKPSTTIRLSSLNVILLFFMSDDE